MHGELKKLKIEQKILDVRPRFAAKIKEIFE
jgi:hypothetical protein